MDRICPYCGASDSEHDREQLARECQPKQIEVLRNRLLAIRNHWREFGPDHGFDEVLETYTAQL